MKTSTKLKIGVAVVLVIFQLIYSSVYKVDENEQVIVTRFGAIRKGPITKPGYHFKFLEFDQVKRFPTSEILTETQFDPCLHELGIKGATVKWVITDPIEFYKRIGQPERIPVYLNYLLSANYCREAEDKTDAFDPSDASRFLEAESAKCGITISRIWFDR